MVEWARVEVTIYAPELDLRLEALRTLVSQEVNRVANEIILRLKDEKLVERGDVIVEAWSVQRFLQAQLKGDGEDA